MTYFEDYEWYLQIDEPVLFDGWDFSNVKHPDEYKGSAYDLSGVHYMESVYRSPFYGIVPRMKSFEYDFFDSAVIWLSSLTQRFLSLIGFKKMDEQ